MSQLHCESTGSGPALVMVHGWAMHGGIFDRLARRLADHFEVIRVDLPGHGRSSPRPCPDEAGAILDDWVGALHDRLPQTATWLGWSLGGQLCASLAARHPTTVSKLILMASNPQFVRDDHWQYGMDPVYFEAFAKSVHTDYRKTLLRFLALQTRGSDHSREDLRLLKHSLFEHGEPDPESVFRGLTLLRDLRIADELSKIHAPTLVMLGERDTLVPRQAGNVIFEQLREAHLSIIHGAGHAPFLSHEADVAAAIRGFIANHDRHQR